MLNHLINRVHFLMAGSFRVNDQKLDHDGGGNAETASLEIDLCGDLLSFYKSAVIIRYICISYGEK